ncbi:unnamed protein product [Discula destructiva]
MTTSNGTSGHEIRCDALIIGAGFSGISMLYKLRQLGLNAKIFEAGDNFGGTWYWNRYPGARVDSEFPFYQLNIPELYRTWTFKERYPDHRELRRYFAHADKVLNLAKDTIFNAKVVDCSWDDNAGEWTIKTEQGRVAKTRFLLLCSGLLHQRHIPDFPGLKDFKGQIFHSSFYPEDLDLKGKKVALVGAGATAVQITQEVAKQAEHLTIFLRRPSLCLPAQQRPISKAENHAWRGFLHSLMASGRKSKDGFLPAPPNTQNALDVSPEERDRFWEEMWEDGAFRLSTQNYQDIMISKEANALVYEFWAKKVRARMTDPAKMDQMAPLPADKMPYHIFTKRPPLEMDYYECVDRPNVDVVNTKTTLSKAFNETGIMMEDGRQIDFDILILATGFDAFSGSLTNMGLKSRDGVDIKDYWKDGIRALFGTTFAGYPNAFMTYTPFAPTALSNGTTIIEIQCDFACAAIRKVLDSERKGSGGRGIKSIEALASAEDEWAAYVEAQNAPTLFPLTQSWWTGANIPGKKSQLLTYLKGIGEYEKETRDRLERLEGFDVRYWDGAQEANASSRGTTSLKRKAGGEPMAEHVEHVEHGEDGSGKASETVEILRPTAST